MKSLEDLRNRLSSGNKRVFAIFHKLMPTQPLVFVHASLESKVPAGMDQVMEVPNSIDDHPKVAAFYSISNGHRGLAGVGLGEFLLKEATKVSLLTFAMLHSSDVAQYISISEFLIS
jgi:malonyl-CoA decarboxylase